ncbi:MAG TPA: flagellar motor protein MotS [Pseudogracilibacillus sp.]|nr:flagellar motor protein MotS [Pseudogracilibacillus sp.]
MKRRERKRSDDKGAPKWMVTYSDMVTLVLVFFILLFSMSQIDVTKFESITRSFQSRAILDFLPSAIPSEDITADDIEGQGGDDLGDKDATDGDNDDEDIDLDGMLDQLEEWEKKADALARLMENVEEFLADEGLGDVISANRTEEGVHLVLQDSILFDSGEAVILDSGVPFLDEVGLLLTGIDNTVRVEGHTDSRPISTYRYPSNWELSGARAGSVVRHFIEEQDLDPNRFLIAGYGDTRPVVKEDTPENMSKNRRVEIVILDKANE